VFITQTVNQKTTQVHLCESCAGEQTALGAQPFTLTIDPSALLKDFFSNFFPGMEMPGGGTTGETLPADRVPAADPAPQCPGCGYPFSLFQQTGRLGCPQCYASFAALLEPMIASVHGGGRHVEEALPVPIVPAPTTEPPLSERKSTKKTGKESELRKLLKRAVEGERFEEAARLRDEIRGLKDAG
jgi:protein arginine kinase activator